VRRNCRPSLEASGSLAVDVRRLQNRPARSIRVGFLRLTAFNGRDEARQSAAVQPCSAVIGVWARARPDAGLLTADPLDTGWSAADSPGPSPRPKVSLLMSGGGDPPNLQANISGTTIAMSGVWNGSDKGATSPVGGSRPVPKRSLVNGLMTETGFASAAHGRNGFGSLFSPAGCAGIPRGSKKRPAAVFR
jgi:hypothetical protein